MDGLKQRIIGALVLISLAVIFVPMIFDEPHSERQSTPITIPEEPPFPEVEMPAGQSSSGVRDEPLAQPGTEETPVAGQSSGDPGYRMVEEPASPAEPPAEEPQPEPVEPPVAQSPEPAPEPEPEAAPEPKPAEEPEQPKEFSKTLEGAWVVQLGSFGSADNARRLRDKVVEMDYGAHLQQVERGDTQLTRVFSGPFASKSDAEKAKAALDKEFGLNSLVTSGGK